MQKTSRADAFSPNSRYRSRERPCYQDLLVCMYQGAPQGLATPSAAGFLHFIHHLFRLLCPTLNLFFRSMKPSPSNIFAAHPVRLLPTKGLFDSI